MISLYPSTNHTMNDTCCDPLIGLGIAAAAVAIA